MFAPKSDDRLIQSALAGSEQAWLTLIKRYEKRLYNYALRMCGSRDDAMDILQDVLLSVYRNLESYRGDGKFAAWLFRIASFRCIDYFRRRHFHEDIDDVEVADDISNSPEINLGSAQSNKDIVRLMSRLPVEQRHVVELKFFQSFTFEEIGGQLGVSSNTAKTRLYSALAKMRKQSDISLAS